MIMYNLYRSGGGEYESEEDSTRICATAGFGMGKTKRDFPGRCHDRFS